MIYCSPHGSDANPGTRNLPLYSPCTAVEKAKNNPADDRSVILLEGDYTADAFPSPVIIDADCVKLIAEGRVTLSGKVPLSLEGENVTKHPDGIVCVKLDGITEIPSRLGILDGDSRFHDGDRFCEPARFPNNLHEVGRGGAWLNAERIDVAADGRRMKITARLPEDCSSSLPDGKTITEDSYVCGYLCHQWCYTISRVYSHSVDDGILTVETDAVAYMTPGTIEGGRRRFFITGLRTENPAPGEYSLDRERGMIYYNPIDNTPNFGTDSLSLSLTSTECMVQVRDVKNVEISGITFSHTRDAALRIADSADVTVRGCTFSHIGANAVNVERSKNVKLVECEIYDTASGGIYFSRCGDRYTLTDSGCALENCVIKDYNRIQTCYRPAVKIADSCGVNIAHCTLKDAPHQAVLIEHSNDIVLRDSIIENMVRDTDDASAIYWGRDPSVLGVELTGNIFRNIGNPEADYAVSAIYLDDYTVCPVVKNNVFVHCCDTDKSKASVFSNANGLMLNNAQFLDAENNIFIEATPDEKPCNLYMCPSMSRFITYASGAAGSATPTGSDWYEWLAETGFFTDAWISRLRGTVWEAMYSLITKERHERIMRILSEKGDSDETRTALAWDIADETWIKSKSADECERSYSGSLRDYVYEKWSSEISGEQNGNPMDSPLSGLLFWKTLYGDITMENTNIFRSNVSFGMNREYLTPDGGLKGNVMNGFPENYNPLSSSIDGKPYFVLTENSFSLTEEGEADILAHLPSFVPFSLSSVGASLN